MALPDGVRKYTGEGSSQDHKGSNHPEAIGSNRATTGSGSGSPPARKPNKASGKDAGGTENMKANQETLQGKAASMPGKGKDSRPSGVAKHDGTRAPKPIAKSPK